MTTNSSQFHQRRQDLKGKKLLVFFILWKANSQTALYTRIEALLMLKKDFYTVRFRVNPDLTVSLLCRYNIQLHSCTVSLYAFCSIYLHDDSDTINHYLYVTNEVSNRKNLIRFSMSLTICSRLLFISSGWRHSISSACSISFAVL